MRQATLKKFAVQYTTNADPIDYYINEFCVLLSGVIIIKISVDIYGHIQENSHKVSIKIEYDKYKDKWIYVDYHLWIKIESLYNWE